MSGRKAKQQRKNDPKTNILLINHSEYKGKDEVIAYLLEKIKPFNGYKFISISAVGSVYKDGPNKQVAAITVHWSIPNMNERGRYVSDKDITIEAIKVSDPEFKGVVIDRHGNGIVGNPFAPADDIKNAIPAIGDEEAKSSEPSPFTGDEEVKSI